MSESGGRGDSDGLPRVTEVFPGQNLKDGRSPRHVSFSDTGANNAKRPRKGRALGLKVSNLRGEPLVENSKKQRSGFIRVKCQDCGGEEKGQVIFSQPSTMVTCNVCGATLIKPQGGKGKIRGEILGEVE